MKMYSHDLNTYLCGGVIMDVASVEQAKIAEKAGAVAVMALERVPADILAAGGVSRMSDPALIRSIMKVVKIPVMAKVRIGHFVEALVLQALGVDYIDESEVLTPADPYHYIDKTQLKTPCICGARNLGEALRRIEEGAAMMRTKGEPGTGDVLQAVKHLRTVDEQIRQVASLRDHELNAFSSDLSVPLELLRFVHKNGRLPVPNFSAGGVATPADAALMRHLGADGVFVGSGIFKSGDPIKRAKAIVEACRCYDDPERILAVSENLGEAMVGINPDQIGIIMSNRGGKKKESD